MAKRMRALSIRQPYAEQIMDGGKVIEYRRRLTRIRDRVYVYACKAMEPVERYEEAGYAVEEVRRGVLVGTVEIVNCTERDGEYEWHLAAPRRLARPRLVEGMPQAGFFWPFGR